MQETDGGTISHAWMESRVVNEGYQPGISQEQCRHIQINTVFTINETVSATARQVRPLISLSHKAQDEGTRGCKPCSYKHPSLAMSIIFMYQSLKI